jgi:hypothetical protein
MKAEDAEHEQRLYFNDALLLQTPWFQSFTLSIQSEYLIQNKIKLNVHLK